MQAAREIRVAEMGTEIPLVRTSDMHAGPDVDECVKAMALKDQGQEVQNLPPSFCSFAFPPSLSSNFQKTSMFCLFAQQDILIHPNHSILIALCLPLHAHTYTKMPFRLRAPSVDEMLEILSRVGPILEAILWALYLILLAQEFLGFPLQVNFENLDNPAEPPDWIFEELVRLEEILERDRQQGLELDLDDAQLEVPLLALQRELAHQANNRPIQIGI